MQDLSNDIQCIYRILISCVLLVLSLTMITIERARCLYALLVETSIDYGSLVTSMMMSVQLTSQSATLPYETLITRIVENAEVSIVGMRESPLD